MKVLDFINANGILFGGIFSIITALITAFATHVIEGKREKKETIKNLQNEVAKLKSDIKRFEDQEAADKAIDKSDGSLYVESMPNGSSRVICGFCWEEKSIRSPLVPTWYYGDHEEHQVCTCSMCKRYCRGLDVWAEKHANVTAIDTADLPF